MAMLVYRSVLENMCFWAPKGVQDHLTKGKYLSLRNLSTQISGVGAIGWTTPDSPENRKKLPKNDDFHKEFMSTKSCYLQATCSFSVNKNWPDWFVADFCLWYDTPLLGFLLNSHLSRPSWRKHWKKYHAILPSPCVNVLCSSNWTTTTFTKFSAVRGSRQIKTNNLFICAEARRLLWTIPSWRIETSTKIPKCEWQVTALMILLALVTKVLWSHCQRGCRFLGSRCQLALMLQMDESQLLQTSPQPELTLLDFTFILGSLIKKPAKEMSVSQGKL